MKKYIGLLVLVMAFNIVVSDVVFAEEIDSSTEAETSTSARIVDDGIPLPPVPKGTVINNLGTTTSVKTQTQIDAQVKAKAELKLKLDAKKAELVENRAEAKAKMEALKAKAKEQKESPASQEQPP